METAEDAFSAAAILLGLISDNNCKKSAIPAPVLDASELVKKGLWYLKAIHAADITASDANAPYDVSLAGVVYALLDIITLLGIIPQLSPGIVFGHRPRSVVSVPTIQATSACKARSLLAEIIDDWLSILEQHGSGIQPLLWQRVLPDIITALMELAFSPASNVEDRLKFAGAFQRTMSDVPTSRLLPILTTLLQQLLPPWLKPIVSYELSIIPLRTQGIRHTIEFLSLAYLQKSSRVSMSPSGPQSQLPIPIEVITQASHLLMLPPRETSQIDWLRKLAPQLLELLDGGSGQEMTRAAGQIIAGGILSKKATGAPGSIGWELFATPLLHKIYPTAFEQPDVCAVRNTEVIVQESDLRVALKRISAIASSYSHIGLLKRLIGPIILPLWALLNFAKHRRSLDDEWMALPHAILTRYMTIACDAKHVDMITLQIFWDGDAAWIFGSGSHGGVEIRRRMENTTDLDAMDSIMSRIGDLHARAKLLADLLVDANISDEMAGSIFLLVAKRWLTPAKHGENTLSEECEIDPLSALINVKLSEMLATSLSEKLARSPRHIVELMVQLVQNVVSGYRLRDQKAGEHHAPTRAMLRNIVKMQERGRAGAEGETADEDLVTYALSVLSTLISSPGFRPTAETTTCLHTVLPALTYLVQHQGSDSISPLIRNSATTLLQLLDPRNPSMNSDIPTMENVLNEHQATLKAVLAELQSPEPPDRAWALNTMHKLLRNPTASAIIDVPSLTHTLLLVSLADSDSYVHTAAAPVILSLAISAPRIVVKVVTGAFIDIDEHSLRLAKEQHAVEKERALQEALDFRLRVGEVLGSIVLEDDVWSGYHSNAATRYESVRYLVEACLTLASRRGQRKRTLSTRVEVTEAAERLQEDSETAWGGPIPNVLEPEGREANDQAEIDALTGILREWEGTGMEEDVRVRTSALSVLSMVLEHRLDMARQAMVDVSLQLVLTILTMETAGAKAMLRRAAVLVLLGLLHGLNTRLEGRGGSAVDLSITQQQEVESVARWIQDEDVDALAREHAVVVVEGLETLRMKRLFRVREEGLRLGPDLGLEGNLQGLHVTPGALGDGTTKQRIFVEEME